MLTLKIFARTVVTFFLSFFIFVSSASCDGFNTFYHLERRNSIENQRRIQYHTNFGSWRQRPFQGIYYPTADRVLQLSRAALHREEEVFRNCHEILYFYNTNPVNPEQRLYRRRMLERLNREFPIKRDRANRALTAFANAVL